MVGTTTPTQAWSILSRHARDDIAPLRLRDLCTDTDRISSLVTVHSGSPTALHRFTTSASAQNLSLQNIGTNRTLIVDLSRQRVTLETMNCLLRLATSVGVREFIQTLAWGENDRLDPIQPSKDTVHPTHPRPQHFFGEGVTSYGPNARSMPFHHVPNHNAYDEALAPSHPNPNPQPLSPSRSVTTHNSQYKKTRFAQANLPSDESTILSTPHPHPNHPNTPLTPNSPSPSPHPPPLTTIPSMHMSLRAPSHCHLQMLTSHGCNALDQVHSQWKRIQLLAKSIRKGEMKGCTGHVLKHILVIGRGVPVAGVEFVYDALKGEEKGYDGLCAGLSDRSGSHPRVMRFVSRLDPVGIHHVLSDWNPEQTCIISIVLREDEEELLQLTNVIQNWLKTGIKTNWKKREQI